MRVVTVPVSAVDANYLRALVADPVEASTSQESGAPALPASIVRIQRLERLERERLEERAKREQRRQQGIASAKPSGGRHDLVDRIEELTRFPMAVLGILWLVVAITVLTSDARGKSSFFLVGSLFGLWLLFLIEYLVRLVVTPNTKGYVKRRWVEPVTVVVPPLQGWHIVGIEKMGLLLHEGALRLQAILKHHSLFRVLIAASATLVFGAWLVLLFEENAHGSNIHTYPDALWWAIVTVTTVGYGDRFPVTEGGRIVAAILMLVGIGLIGTLTATVASVFIKEHTDSTKEEFKRGHEDLSTQVALIGDRLQDIERRLGATPAEIAAIDSATDGSPTTPDTASDPSPHES
jgi:voltage-gated potassium channel